MSLVNKMLRDLDARRVSDGERSALPAAVTPLAARREPRMVWPWAAAGVVVVVAAIAAWVWGPMAEGTQGPGANVAPESAARSLPAAPPAAPPVAPPAAVLAAVEPPAPASEPNAAAAQNAAVVPVLRMADELRQVPAGSRGPAPAISAAAKPTQSPEVKPVPKTAPASGAETRRRSAIDQPGTQVVPQAPASPAPMDAKVEKQERKLSPAEVAESNFRRGVAAQRQGNIGQATAAYRVALDDYPEHAAARQALAALLIDGRQYDEAENVLRQGTEFPAARLASVLALARLKVERGEASVALDLLRRHAAAGERSAEFQGFFGALLNRAGRSADAVERYQSATRLAPGEARWWAGLGIALDASGNAADAREAYQKARTLPGLPPDLALHVEQRLR